MRLVKIAKSRITTSKNFVNSTNKYMSMNEFVDTKQLVDQRGHCHSLFAEYESFQINNELFTTLFCHLTS